MVARKTPPLEERFSYLCHKISSRIAMIGNRHFRKHSLNHYSARILVLLLEHPSLKMGDLVNLMLLPQSTISTQLQSLHKRGFIARARAQHDNRSVIVALTPSGRKVARDCEELSARVQELIAAGFSATERKLAYQMFERIESRLIAAEGKIIHEFKV
jgi:MarR family transcriptional regulator, organic hydroperoxide resistance regulator